MNIDMYSASIPVFDRFLTNLSGLLDKAEAHAESQDMADTKYVVSRLYADMAPLSSNVQFACDTARRCAARLAGEDPGSEADNEATLDELRARIRRTRDYLAGVDAGRIRGTEDKTVLLETPMVTMEFTGHDYLLNFALPNFFFHVSISHGILRQQGVPIGKMDFMGAA